MSDVGSFIFVFFFGGTGERAVFFFGGANSLLGVLATRLAWLNCRRFIAVAILLERVMCGVRRSFIECHALALGCVRSLGVSLMTRSLNKALSS